ncbi:MAG: NAD(P)/FAD-dependent oxidoreductase [Planctomycetota bacterium]|jgi:glycine/D-amino acid oxidase-like deaminating enzyme
MGLVIVGAGFAGVATAYHLARRGVKGITVLEREAGPGLHASGRNAGLLRQSSHDDVLVPLLRRGARAARAVLRRVPGALQPSGSLILGESIHRMRGGPRARIRDAAPFVPGLKGEALHDPEDALVDPIALLGRFVAAARARGVQFRFEEELVGVKGARVETTRRTLDAEKLVVAAGAWSADVAALAGSRAVHLEARRRHLFRGSVGDRAAAGWPFVWHETEGVYFRPESGGVLLSPCDAEPHPAESPEVDERCHDLLAGKLAAVFPDVGDWRVGPGWACLRTFAADERFVIGPDPHAPRLFWVAGLGGHGVTAAWAVGRLAAALLLGRADAGPFDPRRFAS